MKNKFKVGDSVDLSGIKTIRGELLNLPSRGLMHLQFRRFATCPICNLHLQDFIKRYTELNDANITEAVIFHTYEDEMKAFGELPFYVIADPHKIIYQKFGVGTSIFSMLNPMSWWSGLKGIFIFHKIPHNKDQGHLGLPADFFISPNGKILALKYGKHADDHWGFDEVLKMSQSLA